MKDMFIALMIAVSILCGGLYFGYLVVKVRREVHEDLPRPPTCIEARGPATDEAEHEWSMRCLEITLKEMSVGLVLPVQRACIESACIAFRGLP